MNKEISAVHLKAQELREQGETVQALVEMNHAILEYIENKQYDQLAHAYLDKVIIFRHFYDSGTEAERENYIFQAEKSLAEAKNVLPQTTDPQLQVLVNVEEGQVEGLKENWQKASELHQIAFDLETDAAHKAHVQAHLAEAQAHLQNPEYLNNFDQAIAALEEVTQKTPYYEAWVWLTGAYLRKAEATQDPSLVSKAYEIAKEHKLEKRIQQIESWLNSKKK